MGIFDKFRTKKQQYCYINMMNGSTPIFTQFGNDIYASDIVQGCIRCISSAIAKCKPRHIRTTENGIQQNVKSSINRLLKFQPNPYMTTSDFLEKIVYLREMYKNAFIYPAFHEIPLKDGYVKREYVGFYPLQPIQTTFLQDDSGTIWIEFLFSNGESYTFPYQDIIHWRKDFGANEFMGGDSAGGASNNAILKLLQTDHTVLESMDNAVRSTTGVRGIIKVHGLFDLDKQKEVKNEFEQKLKAGQSGFVTMDAKSDFIPISLNPKVLDKDTMEFVEQRILNQYGISIAVYNGDFTEEQYQSFYEKTLENMLISLGQCFTATLFTDREIDFGNEIVFYNQGLLYTSMKNKIAVVDILSSRGTFTDNQILSVFGYPPFEGGDKRKQSLNYINAELADSYQMQGKGSDKT
ncbi:MAG: phage portal protein [Firmicutes bacterium]|nr:phage portal protein [Bacillota bacterium]